MFVAQWTHNVLYNLWKLNVKILIYNVDRKAAKVLVGIKSVLSVVEMVRWIVLKRKTKIMDSKVSVVTQLLLHNH